MHELAICQELIKQATTIALQHGATQILRINIAIGPLAGVEPALLAHAFPIVIINTSAAQAKLEITTTPIKIRCLECNTITEMDSVHLICAQCQSWRTQLISGDELLLLQLELS